MDKFKGGINDRGRYYFTLERENGIKVSFLIINKDKWHCIAYIDKISNHFEIKDSKFINTFDDLRFANEIEKINEAFYNMVIHIKNNPDFRLRIMTMLNDDIRQIWNQL